MHVSALITERAINNAGIYIFIDLFVQYLGVGCVYANCVFLMITFSLPSSSMALSLASCGRRAAIMMFSSVILKSVSVH